MTPVLEDIIQQPAALVGVRKYYNSPGAIPSKALRNMVRHWPPLVVFTGMGSSLFAAYPAQAFLTAHGIRALLWETAELVHHHLKILGPDTLLVVVSQSGETVEVLRLLESLPRSQKVLAVVNVEASTLARQSALMMPMMASQVSIVSSKTYMCSVAVLMYLAFVIARKESRQLTTALMRIVEEQEEILNRADEVAFPSAEFFNHPPFAAMMSRGADLSTVYQGALTMKEVVRLAVEPTSAAQFRHGPIEIVDPSHRYIIFARQGAKPQPPLRIQSRTGKMLLGLAEEIRSHGGRVLLLSDMPSNAAPNLRIVPVKQVRLGLGTLVDTLHIQLLSHELGLRAGLEPGKFWIAEEVTHVE